MTAGESKRDGAGDVETGPRRREAPGGVTAVTGGAGRSPNGANGGGAATTPGGRAGPVIAGPASGAFPPAPAELRRAMGTFATGVTVVTGVEGGEPVGFACQSFASVSLEPPLVLFCADHHGRTWPRIRRSGRFCANVLAEEQIDICRRFGSGRGKKYDGLGWDLSRWGTPALRGVLARVHGEVRDVHVAGDHDVVIGRVLEVETVTGGRPMIFFRGGFGIDRPEPPAPIEPALWGWGDH